ncbi:1-phosphofructokinase family hexose kinase [Microcella flavibacter]|uniref:1-phosphofructokinase family hexose kinase n=1 Tax=Microcella flavibacter TaxID=1804990 RepID=UPI0014564A85|nr:hexose kinase [Microcella flavibacter]
MIVTLTANPALDRTITLLAPLRPGEVQAAGSVREDAGGKGVNVARAVAAAGQPTLAVLPLAEHDAYAVPLQASGVAARRVPVHGAVRANLTIVDPAGETTKLNLSGSPLTDQDARALVSAVVDACAGARWLVLAGSLPPGAADDFYVRVVESVRAAHGGAAPRVAVDTSGPALRAVIDAGLADLIKPNDEELAELAGVALPEPAEGAPTDAEAHAAADAAVLAVARALVPARARAALVTLGSRGALLVTADGAWAARAPRIRLASTVGAGDSSLAGYLLAESAGGDEPERLRTAIRYGAAAASLPGTQPPAPHDLPADELEVLRLE